MSLSNHATTALGATTGTAGITFPYWWSSILDALGGAWPVVIQGGGFIVIVLTVRKLMLESRLASRRLKEMDRAEKP